MNQSPPSELEPAGRRNFSVRLPTRLYEELEAVAARRATSMNRLIGEAVAAMVGRPDMSPAGASDIAPQIARDAIRQGPQAIGALKGIAKHVSNKDQVSLACVLWAAAARLVAADESAQRASEELAHTAHTAETASRHELAVALWQEALTLDPNNLDAANRLGQRLHHLAQRHGDDTERYREAERHLARVTFVDNHAKLFHGWSALYVARADADADAVERAVVEIEDALKAWAFGERDGHLRLSWLRQVERLRTTGREPEAARLVEFANRNARWGAIETEHTASEAAQ